MTDQRTIAPTEDPVCGMTVHPEQSREQGLTLNHERSEYAFRDKGCLLAFGHEPGMYLAAESTPTM